MTFIDRIKACLSLIKNFEALSDLIEKIEALGATLERLGALESRLVGGDALESLASRIERLDEAVNRIEVLEQPKELVASNGHVVSPEKEDLHEWNRLQLLSKFVALSGKAREIELEWQKVQQDEHDASFAFQSLGGDREQSTFIYKKGIVDGIKWCVNKFS